MNFFYVTSFITEKVSRRIIEEEEIEEFKIISDERYKPNNGGYIPSKKIYDIKKPLKRNLIKNWKSIIDGNKKISKIAENKFDIYVPNTNIEFVRIIISHRLLKDFYFMEEGFTSYCEFGDIEIKNRGLKKRAKENIVYLGSIEEGEIFKEGYSGAYGMSEYCFPNWRRKKVVEPNFSKEESGLKIGRNSCILVIDSMRTIGESKKEVYISTLSRAVVKMENKYEKIYYKMHPDNRIYGNKRIFESIVESSICKTEKIGQKHSIEKLSIGSGSDVIVNLSSAGLYCLLFSNSTVYTFYDMFRRQARMAGIQEENILGFEQFVPDIFWENALPLQESK